MAINTVDDVVDGLVNSSQLIRFRKHFSTFKASGAFASSWTAGGFPGAGATPPAYTAGSGYTCDKATPGAIPFNNASISNLIAKLTATVSGQASTQGTLILMDRLWSCSGIPFGAGSHSITTPGSLPARVTDGGIGVEAWVENFVAAGAATGTLTLNYLDAGGTPRVGGLYSVTSIPSAQQVQPMWLAPGAVGISQVTSVTKSNSWTSGSFGITLMRRLVEIPVSGTAGISVLADWTQTALTSVHNDACLQVVWQAGTSTLSTVLGTITLIDK